MSQKTVFLKEVLSTMATLDANGKAVPFNISVRTLNNFSKTGGKLNTYKNARLVQKEKYKEKDSIMSLRTAPKKIVNRKNPHHFEEKTRNLKLASGKIKKIHIRYIIEFNGKKVIY